MPLYQLTLKIERVEEGPDSVVVVAEAAVATMTGLSAGLLAATLRATADEFDPTRPAVLRGRPHARGQHHHRETVIDLATHGKLSPEQLLVELRALGVRHEAGRDDMVFSFDDVDAADLPAAHTLRDVYQVTMRGVADERRAERSRTLRDRLS